MDDTTRMWITAVPPFGPDDVGVLVAVDTTSPDPGERRVCDLLGRGYEGEAGVFHLLPWDLAARYRRAGDRLEVRLVTSDGAPGPQDGADRAEPVTLASRAIVTDFEPAAQGDARQPVLVVEHTGPAGLPELLALLERGETGIAVLRAD